MAVGDICKIKPEIIAPGGDALGRIEGKAVFVEGGAPDETVICRIIEEHKSWARAQLLEISEKSPARIEAACSFYGECGGCNLAHIDYKTQLEAKSSILNESMQRIGGFSAPDIELFPCAPWEYRNRMQFHCFREKKRGNDGLSFGLMGRGNKIIAINDCPIADNGIRELLRSGSSPGKAFALPPNKDRFTVFSKDGLLLSEGEQSRGKIRLLDTEITLDAALFFQSNVSMLEKLILELRKIAEKAKSKELMADLYAGVGTFALFVGTLFEKVIIAEENKSAVSLAKENLRGKNAEFFALRDTEWEKAVLRQKPGIGFAIVDPPRAGLSVKPARALAQEGPPLLAYVSCDAASLARDSGALVKGGYKLTRLCLFDFYPQTSHIESLAVFKKSCSETSVSEQLPLKNAVL